MRKIEYKRAKVGNRYRWEVRRNNKIISWQYVKGSDLRTLQDVKERYEDKSTLKPRTKRYTNVQTEERLKDTKLINGKLPEKIPRKPRAKKIQYQVSGYIDKVHIVGRSQILGSAFAQDVNQARNEAWQNFFKQVGENQRNHYSVDEGMKHIDKIRNLQEGWVIYNEIKKNKTKNI